MTVLPFTLRQLEVFERVCETRSFRRASEELGISQASVSNQLKALEEQLGIRLLLREAGKRAELTSEGAAFLADLGTFREASLALALHRRAIPDGRREQPVTLNLLIGPYLFADYVRPKLGRFFEEHPHIQLEIDAPLVDRDFHKALRSEKHHLAIFQDEPFAPLRPGYRELARASCGVYGHPKFLAGADAGLSADEIGGLPFLLPAVGTNNEGLVLRRLARAGIKPSQIVGRTHYFEIMIETFERGDAIGAAAESMMTKIENRKSVMLYRLDDLRLTMFRNPDARLPQVDAAERFLVSAVLGDSDYPAI